MLFRSPYIFNIYHFYQLELAQDFITKSSLANVPLPITLIRYFLIAALFLLVTMKKGKEAIFFSAFLLAGILIAPISKLVLNQDLETFHYLRRALMPFATIAFLATIYFFFEKNKKLLNALAIIIIATFTFYGLNVQMIASGKIESAHVRNQSMMNVLYWFNQNVQKNSVIGSLNTDLESLIPVYTNNRVFFPPTDRTIMPTIEGVTRYAILNNLLGIENSLQKRNLDNIMSYLFVYQSYNKNLNLDLNSPRRDAAEREIDRLSNASWENEAKKFKLDYIVLTPQEKNLAVPNNKPIPAAALDGYKIYKYER